MEAKAEALSVANISTLLEILAASAVDRLHATHSRGGISTLLEILAMRDD